MIELSIAFNYIDSSFFKWLNTAGKSGYVYIYILKRISSANFGPMATTWLLRAPERPGELFTVSSSCFNSLTRELSHFPMIILFSLFNFISHFEMNACDMYRRRSLTILFYTYFVTCFASIFIPSLKISAFSKRLLISKWNISHHIHNASLPVWSY